MYKTISATSIESATLLSQEEYENTKISSRL